MPLISVYQVLTQKDFIAFGFKIELEIVLLNFIMQ